MFTLKQKRFIKKELRRRRKEKTNKKEGKK